MTGNERQPRRYLITGGAGFIGSHLADALVERGDQVTVIDDLSTGKFENIAHLEKHPRFRFAIDSITHEAVMDRLGSECDVIFHLAAAVGVDLVIKDPVHVIETNVLGTHEVLKVANRYRKKVLIASTSEIYGKNGSAPFHEDSNRLLGPTTKNRWSYSTSKAMDEFLGLAYFRQMGLPVVIFRLFNTVGPRQTGRYGMVVPRFVQQALRGEPIRVFGDGNQTRCFCCVEDTVRGLLGLAECEKAVGQVFNIGSTEEIAILDLARMILDLANPKGERRLLDPDHEIVFIPYDKAYEVGFEDMLKRVPDVTKIREFIGWEPRVSLLETLREVIASFENGAESAMVRAGQSQNEGEMFSDQVILVTGGTGSFGRKFAQLVLREHSPRKLIIFSRDELKQHDMRLSGFDLPAVRFFIGDVRDPERLRRAMQGVDIVVHAAALKQVPACEYNPIEAVLTNVMGARNVIEAALDMEVTKVLALSSDKAVNPVNLYGATKLVAEKLFIQGNAYSGSSRTRFSCVRYGNVVGSRGSVVPLFLGQRSSGTLTITDPRMTRFWLTLDQGARFVIRCIASMHGGEVFVPKIPSMNILDLAKAMAPGCRLENIGIRAGEKLHEVLISEDEFHQTLDLEEMFVIKPAHPWWKTENWKEGRKVSEGFRYASNSNGKWLSVEELKEILGELEASG